jgi:hypothetical protein
MTKQILGSKKYNYSWGDSRYEKIESFNEIHRTEMNSEYHRTISLDTITSDYILVCGCSQSQGESVALEKTYSSILQETLGIPVYNMSISGSGCDFISTNIQEWCGNFPIKPKHVVIQWSHIDTRMYHERDQMLYHLGPWTIDKNFRHDLWKKEHELQSIYISTMDKLSERSTKFRLELHEFLNLHEIKYTEFKYGDQDNIFPDVDAIQQIDVGSDGRHMGEKSHQHLAETISKIITDTMKIK